jgi:hypothetical protein
MKIACRHDRVCATLAQPATRRKRKTTPNGLKSPGNGGACKAATDAPAMPKFQKLPDPFLYETEALIADLDSVRELILRIPVHNDTVLPTNAAIATVWDLRERIRELAVLRLQSQRHWQTKAKSGPEHHTPAAAQRRKKARKVAAISRA